MLIGIDASRTTVARRTGTENYALSLTRELLALGRDPAEHRFRLYFNQTHRRPALSMAGQNSGSSLFLGCGPTCVCRGRWPPAHPTCSLCRPTFCR